MSINLLSYKHIYKLSLAINVKKALENCEDELFNLCNPSKSAINGINSRTLR